MCAWGLKCSPGWAATSMLAVLMLGITGPSAIGDPIGNVIEIDGHDIVQIIDAFDGAESVKGKPTIIIANTVKGKGVSFMEDNVDWHGKSPTKEQAEEAIKEIESN